MMLERGRYPLALNLRLPVLRVAGVVLLTRLNHLEWQAREFMLEWQTTFESFRVADRVAGVVFLYTWESFRWAGSFYFRRI